MLDFRIAKRADLTFITRIYNQNIPKLTVTADLRPVSVTDELESFNNHNSKRPLWIIQRNDTPVGWVGLESFYGRPAYHTTVEISIYIDNKFQRNGIGKSALNFISHKTKKLNIHTILAFIFSVNVPSQKLFKTMGYHKYGHLPKVADMNGKMISLDILGKKFD